jgi:hypothetical protein
MFEASFSALSTMTLFHQMIERVPRNVSAYYDITEVFEMGKMATMFFSKTGTNIIIQMARQAMILTPFVAGKTLFYVCITIYLYGDLAIYGLLLDYHYQALITYKLMRIGAAVAKSLRDVWYFKYSLT